MLNNKLDRILYLHPVPPCPKLKKWNKAKETGIGNAEYIAGAEEMYYNTVHDSGSKDLGLLEVWGGIANQRTRNIKNPLYRILTKLFYTIGSLGKKDKNVLDVFSDIKTKLDEIEFAYDDPEESKKVYEILDLVNNTYQDMITHNIVDAQFDIEMAKLELRKSGYNKLISEQDLIKFIRSSEMGLCLSEISSYTKPIPTNVIEKVKEADDTCLFDNFFILYYDPDKVQNIFYNRSIEKKIEEEKEKQKDPIIFGAVCGITDLFYIADWEDDNCSLTWDKLISTITKGETDG